MKKIITSFLLVTVLLLSSGCGEKTDSGNKDVSSKAGTSSTDSVSSEVQTKTETRLVPKTIRKSRVVEYEGDEIVTYPEEDFDEIEDTAPYDTRPDGETAGLTNPMTGKYSDASADALRKAARSGKDTPINTVKGKVYYVSSKNGNDKNDGTSPAKAWKTLERASRFVFADNDALLFERGGIYRGQLTVKNNNFLIGAFGTGENPCIYGSAKNYVSVEWNNIEGNVWECSEEILKNVGNIVFDHGKNTGSRMTSKALTRNFQFYRDPSTFKLWLYYDGGNPAKVFKDIEICTNSGIIGIQTATVGTVIENLVLKYTGGHGIFGTIFKNVTVKNCEIGWIGGAVLSGSTRYGNAIESFGGCDGFTVENCYIYQCYDTGITFQGGTNDKYTNVLWKNNLVEYCTWALEWWVSNDESDINNVLIENNVLRFAGYGWATPRRVEGNCCLIQSWGSRNPSSGNFVIKNNILDASAAKLVNIGSAKGESNIPQLLGNTYIQEQDSFACMTWGDKTFDFAKTVSDYIKSIKMDLSPTVYFR